MVERKVKGLNKLTMEKFDSISDQKVRNEKDGRTLVQKSDR